MIDVVQEHVQSAYALDDAGLDLPPFRGGDDAGDQVERQNAVDRGGVGIDGEGDAALQQVAFGVHGAAAQGFDGELGQASAEQFKTRMRRMATAQRFAEEIVRVVAL